MEKTTQAGELEITEMCREDGFYEFSPATIDVFFQKTIRETPTMGKAYEAATEEVRSAMRNSFRCGIRACEMVRRELEKWG